MRCLCLLLIFGVPLASAVTHSLRYVYTATSGIPNFPEFVNLGLVDGEQIDYYDSNIKKAIPKQEWMAKSVDSDYWDSQTQTSIGAEQDFKNNIMVAKERFNQTGGVHTWQYMYGCEWDDETRATQGFRQYGYDGRDFIVYDMKTFTWIAPVTQAEITQRKWNSDTANIEYLKNYITKQCVEWLQKYVGYGRSMLERKVSPEVSLLQKDSSSPVECHATGFYPRQVMVSWQKNDQDLSEDVDLRETVPNGDGTFQKSSVLSVKPEEWNKKPEVYTCVVQHGGKDIIVKLNVENIKTNSGSNNMGIIIGVVIAAVVLIAVVVGVFMWKRSKRSKSDYGKANTSETDSENSDRNLQKA